MKTYLTYVHLKIAYHLLHVISRKQKKNRHGYPTGYSKCVVDYPSFIHSYPIFTPSTCSMDGINVSCMPWHNVNRFGPQDKRFRNQRVSNGGTTDSTANTGFVVLASFILLTRRGTVKTVIIHTAQWTVRAMAYQRLWVQGGTLKKCSKNPQKIGKIM